MCENYDWSSVDRAGWRDVPFVENRLATDEDVRCGRAVFYFEGEASQVVTGLNLPALAELINEDGKVEIVIIIQVEAIVGEEDTFTIGYRRFDGGNGVGLGHEFKLIDTSKP